MTHTHTTLRVKTLRASLIAVILLFFMPAVSHALTPIARTNVVPYQRIEYGTTFKFGVVAFSKVGIDRVDFAISGQGYSGGTKSSSSMSYNDRSGTHEYWVSISSAEFTSNGTITVTPTVYGDDADSRVLPGVTQIVEPTGAGSHFKAWVDAASGNDLTGEVGNSNKPYKTLSAAISSAQTVNSGNSDGNIIYLEEGTYSGAFTASTTNEWLTITAATNAAKENIIITGAGNISSGNMVKFSGITLQSLGAGNFVIDQDEPESAWVHDCSLIGSGRHTASSNPVYRGANWNYPLYVTDTYINNTDYGIHYGDLARRLTIENIGNDAFQNTLFVINCRVDGIDPGTSTGWHADAYQSYGDGPTNRIIYGFYATDLHYQGIFMRASNSPAQDFALVNVLIELRTPIRGGGFNGIYGEWDHLLMWHNTFINRLFRFDDEPVTGTLDINNSSLIGNYFYEFENSYGGVPSYLESGNYDGNECLNNHYYYSHADGYGTNNKSYSPDSGSPATDTVGTLELDLTDTATYVHFGYPKEGSIIIDRIPFTTVPADAVGNPRDQKPDVGALEGTSSPPPPPSSPPVPPKNLHIIGNP